MRHKIATKEIQQDTTIRLRFEGGSWAAMTFQYYKERDWWQVVISSDWGNWSYGWGRQGSGKDIFEFMATNNISYFVDKLSGRNNIFSIEKTLKNMRKVIREEYPWIRDKEENEKYMFMISELQSCENIDQVWGSLDKELCKALGDDSYDICLLMEEEWHPRDKYFFTKIFPKFFPEIKKIAKKSTKERLSA